MNRSVFCLVLCVLCFTVGYSFIAVADSTGTPKFSKVMIVILENRNYDEAIKGGFLADLAKKGALLANFHGIWHPSQPNYVALTSGGMHEVLTDNNYDLNVLNITDLLEHAGKSWKVYEEQYPGNCFQGATSGKYARKHNPFISYDDIRNNPSRCAHIVNADQLAQDIANDQIPDYSFYAPDLNNDGHDTNAAFSDNWLKNTFSPLTIENPKFMKDMLLVVTFDESEALLPNHIVTVLYGAGVKTGAVSNQRYSHVSLLSTIEAEWNLGKLNLRDALTRPITDIWQ